MDQLSKIMPYEEGQLDDEQIVDLFQELIDSGLAWQLQGHYGRQANALIDAGICHLPETQAMGS